VQKQRSPPRGNAERFDFLPEQAYHVCRKTTGEIMSTIELYERHIKSLPSSEQLQLVELIAKNIASTTENARPKTRSIMELEGLGAEIWEGIDAQEYVNELRKEWDHRP
jgi:hypothetical protein